MPLFPTRQALTAEDSPPRRFAHSVAGMAIITGVLVQSFHGVIVRLGAARSGVLFVVGILGQLAILLGLTTMHLGSHPVHQWRWRAPIFALVESLTAMTMTAVLIATHSEIVGAQRAHWHDWFWVVQGVFFWHMLTILLFALVLGLTVQWVRFSMLRHEHRDSTALKIHADHLRHEHDLT
jgi:hypothetical protein